MTAYLIKTPTLADRAKALYARANKEPNPGIADMFRSEAAQIDRVIELVKAVETDILMGSTLTSLPNGEYSETSRAMQALHAHGDI